MRPILLFLSLAIGFEAHKILVYNLKFAHSHSNFLGNIADILVEAGHNVVGLYWFILGCFESYNPEYTHTFISFQTSLVPEIAVALKDGTTKSNVVRVPPNPVAAETFTKFESGLFTNSHDFIIHFMFQATSISLPRAISIQLCRLLWVFYHCRHIKAPLPKLCLFSWVTTSGTCSLGNASPLSTRG